MSSRARKDYTTTFLGIAAVVLVGYLIYNACSKSGSILGANQAQTMGAQGAGASQASMGASQASMGAGSRASVIDHGQMPEYFGPQASDLNYQEYDDSDAPGAPLYTQRANEYLSQANPELANWDSTHLLPNASLSNCEDGMITDGPSFNQLNVFSGNKLFEASQAERYFLEIQPRNITSVGPELRPLPPIGSSSLTALPFYQSSLSIQDTLGGLTNYNQALCNSHVAYPAHSATVPVPGGTVPLQNAPVATSV